LPSPQASSCGARAGVTLDPLESPSLRRHPGQLERL